MGAPFKHPDKRKGANMVTVRRSNEQLWKLGLEAKDTRGLAALINDLLEFHEYEVEAFRAGEKG